MIRIGLIGLGEASQVLHIPALKNMPEQYEITAVADPSASLAQYIAEENAIPYVFTSADALLESDTVDAVILCSPDPYHAAQVKKATEHNKHVLIEKPLALDAKDVDDMLDAERLHPELVLMVGYVRRYADPYLKMKEILQKQPRAINYLRSRTLVCEAPFYLNQTKYVYRPNDYPPGMAAENRALRQSQYDSFLGKDATAEQRMVYTLINCSGVHALSAVRELVGKPRRVMSAHATKRGERIVAVLEYDGFMGIYEYMNDLTFAQFDEAIELIQDGQRMHLKYETPYVKNLPVSLEVNKMQQDGTMQTCIHGPYYTDYFKNELMTFYTCIQHGTKPKTSLLDARDDLLLARDIALAVGR